jgi:acid phosphatase
MPYKRSLLKISILLLVIFSAISFYNHESASLSIIQSFTPPGRDRSPTSPHVGSWKTWFHPLQIPAGSESKKHRKGWNLLQHLGGNGPWIEKIDDREESSNLAPPDGCSIEQVHLVCMNLRSSTKKLFHDFNEEKLMDGLRCRVMEKDTPQPPQEIVG